MYEVPQTKVLAEVRLGHEVRIGGTELYNCFQVFLKLWWRVVWGSAEASLCQCL